MTENVIKSDKTKCTLCGLCRTSCPAWKVLLDEGATPRGKAVCIKKDFPSKYLYLCTTCKACENACILKNIDLVQKIKDYRQELVKLGMIPDTNKKMIANIRQYGNPFGPIEPGKKIDLFCC